MDEATGAASLILFLALLAIEIVMYGFGRAIQSLNSGKIQEMAEAGNKRAEQIERIMDQPVDYINTGSEKDRNQISEAVGVCFYQTDPGSACCLDTGDEAV